MTRLCMVCKQRNRLVCMEQSKLQLKRHPFNTKPQLFKGQITLSRDNSLSRINVLVGVHFIRWIAIYPLVRVIRSLNNRRSVDRDVRRHRTAAIESTKLMMWLAKLHKHSPMEITFFDDLSSNSELASVKAHDREVTQQAKYAQDEVVLFIWSPDNAYTHIRYRVWSTCLSYNK